jgi:hypothetical protein
MVRFTTALFSHAGSRFILDRVKAVVTSTTAWGLVIRGPKKAGRITDFVSNLHVNSYIAPFAFSFHGYT